MKNIPNGFWAMSLPCRCHSWVHCWSTLISVHIIKCFIPLLLFGEFFCFFLFIWINFFSSSFLIYMYLRGHDLPQYHTCIEWFNPFRAPNANSKFHSVTRSHHNNAPITEIVPLASIVSSCYLTPKFGMTYHHARWSSADIVEECKFFTLNKYISLHILYKLEQKISTDLVFP